MTPLLVGQPVTPGLMPIGHRWKADPTAPIVAADDITVPTPGPDGWRIPHGWFAHGGDRAGVNIVSDPEHGLWRLEESGATRLIERLPARVESAHLTEGRLFFTLLGSRSRLFELQESSPVAVAPDLDRLSWYSLGLISGDLDGDGVDELIVSTGPSDAFMVKVFRLVPGGLVPVAAGRHGSVHPIAVLPPQGERPARLVVSRVNAHPAAQVFGADDPDGGPCGLEVLEQRGDQLVSTQTLAYRTPRPLCPYAEGAAVDLDGDGIHELLVDGRFDRPTRSQSLWLLQQTPAGHLEEPLILEGTLVRGRSGTTFLVQDPETGAARLTAPDGEPLPPFPRPEVPATDAPCAGLQRALGLHAQAARVCETRLARSSEARVENLLSAIQDWLQAGQPLRAWRALERVTQLPGAVVPEDLRRSVWKTTAQKHPFDLRGQVPREESDLLGDLAPWLASFERPSLTVDLGRALPPALQRPVPPAAIHDSLDGRLKLRIPAGQGPVLQLPLLGDGRAPFLHLAGTWLRGEWASHVSFLLRPVDREAVSVGLSMRGGNGHQSIWLDGRCALSTPLMAIDEQAPLSLQLWWSPDGETLSCRTRIGEEEQLVTSPAPPPPAPGEAWELVVSGAPPLLGASGQLAVLSLDTLELGGLSLGSAPSPEPDPWHAAIVSGEALPAGGDLTDEELTRLAAFSRLYPDLVTRIDAVRPPGTGARLFARAWSVNSAFHPDDAEVQRNLLGGVLPEDLPEEPRIAFTIARGSAHADAGEMDRAAEAFREAAALGRSSSSWRIGLDASARLAEVTLVQGEPEAARAILRQALQATPDLDLAARLIRNRARFAALRDAPEWAFLWHPGDTPAQP